MKASEFVPTRRLYAAFKGDPGAGKSVAAASWAEQGKVRILDFDGKFGAIHNFYTNIVPRPEIINNLEFFQPATFNEGMDLLQLFIEDHSFNREGNTIILDTLTTMVDRLLTDVGIIKGKEKAKEKLKFVGGIQVSDIEDFNAETSALTRLVVGTKSECRCNFIMLAHVVQVHNNALDGSVKTSRQLLTAGKKIAAKLPAYFDEIYHFDSVSDFGGSGQKFYCHTSHSGEDFARTSLPLPAKFDFTKDRLLYSQWMKELKYDKL